MTRASSPPSRRSGARWSRPSASRNRTRKTPAIAARWFLLALLIGSLLLVGTIVWPMASALLVAAVLAMVLAPVQRRLAALLRGRPKLAGVLLVLAVLFLVVGPLVALSAVVVNEASAGVKFIVETVRGEGFGGLIQRLPPQLQHLANEAQAAVGDVGRFVEDNISAQAGRAASAVGTALAATGAFIVQAALMLLALFFLLVGGRDLLAWLDEVSPLGPEHTRELIDEFRKVSYAVIVSTLISAAAQALAALVGYFLTSVPHPVFFTGLTFFAALVPAGAPTVSVVAALILLVTGHPYTALFLALWSVLVVGMVDNVVKPLVMKGDIEMHGGVLFFALIGGLAAFGMVGLLLGPLAIALFLAILRIYRRDFVNRP
ncbi:MAG TPA: AI-2E family transporter [Burkholderiales bacterium]